MHKVSTDEINEVVNIVSQAGSIKISTVVSNIAVKLCVSYPTARFIVRAVLDRELIVTNSKFELYTYN